MRRKFQTILDTRQAIEDLQHPQHMGTPHLEATLANGACDHGPLACFQSRFGATEAIRFSNKGWAVLLALWGSCQKYGHLACYQEDDFKLLKPGDWDREQHKTREFRSRVAGGRGTDGGY